MFLQKCYSRCMRSSFCFLFMKYNLSTSCSFQNKRMAQRGRVLEKLIASNTKQPKKKIYESHSKKSIENVISLAQGTPARESRRHSMLNALFMEYITDIMSTGKISDLIGHGIEIIDAKVTKDFTFVNVHWASYGTEKDDQIQEILNRYSGTLRTELINLHILGKVPRINFIKDQTYGRAYEVQRLLKLADMGPANETSSSQLENDAVDDEIGDTNITKIQSNVFGLNRDELMAKVMNNLNISKNKNSQNNDDISVEKSSPIAISHNFITNKDIGTFLKERNARIRKLKQSLKSSDRDEMLINSSVNYLEASDKENMYDDYEENMYDDYEENMHDDYEEMDYEENDERK